MSYFLRSFLVLVNLLLVESLECYTCDSTTDKTCGTVPEIMTVRNCSSNTSRCLKAVYDTSTVDVVKELLSDEEEDEIEREQTLRIIRKCYEKELFSLPLIDNDCDEREQGFLKHTFCLCTTDLCNNAFHNRINHRSILNMLIIKLGSILI